MSEENFHTELSRITFYDYIFKESRIVPCHKLRRQEKICNEQCLMQFIMINRREDSGVGSNRGEV